MPLWMMARKETKSQSVGMIIGVADRGNFGQISTLVKLVIDHRAM